MLYGGNGYPKSIKPLLFRMITVRFPYTVNRLRCFDQVLRFVDDVKFSMTGCVQRKFKIGTIPDENETPYGLNIYIRLM